MSHICFTYVAELPAYPAAFVTHLLHVFPHTFQLEARASPGISVAAYYTHLIIELSFIVL